MKSVQLFEVRLEGEGIDRILCDAVPAAEAFEWAKEWISQPTAGVAVVIRKAGKPQRRIDVPTLPPLPLSICRGSKVVRVVAVDDPRLLYIEEFNKRANGLGLRARAG